MNGKIIRSDITQASAPWSDAIVWYALGINAMMAKKLNDPASWWYFAAIHGEDLAGQDSNMPGWTNITAPPSIPLGTINPTNPASFPAMWNQCQHGTWFFPPWHRGYLIALEAQLQANISAAGGPSNWGLPYWNYFNNSLIPVEFTQPTLPMATGGGVPFPGNLGGQPNPLYVAMRYGAIGNPTPIDYSCLNDSTYTGVVGGGFGGGQTPFSHFMGDTGDLENNPHNIVHGDVGGDRGNYLGLMGDPVYASLDPIFYLHHCMIDALWAYWNTLSNPSNPGGTNGNPAGNGWLNPPFPNNPGMFLMPWESAGPGTTWHYLPQDVTKLGGLSVRLSNGTRVAYDYTYDFLANPPSSVTPFKQPALGLALGAGQFAKRLVFLSAPATAPISSAPAVRAAELLGASAGPSLINNDGTNISVRIDTGVRAKLSSSLRAASALSPPDRVFLKLESVMGTSGGTSLGVYVNLPGGTKERAGSAGLFGLLQASKVDDKHGGNGLSFIFDISNIIDKLHLANALDSGVLSVSVTPYNPIPAGKNVTVGRVSVYRGMH